MFLDCQKALDTVLYERLVRKWISRKAYKMDHKFNGSEDSCPRKMVASGVPQGLELVLLLFLMLYRNDYNHTYKCLSMMLNL